MKLILRRELGTKGAWKRVATVGYEALDTKTNTPRTLESSMEALLIEQPQVLLSSLTGGLPVVVVKDLQLRPDQSLDPDGDRYPDLVAFDLEGAVYIIECKLAKNPEAKADVLGQVRRYGERLLRLRYEDINTGVRRRAASLIRTSREQSSASSDIDLAEKMKLEAPASPAPWSTQEWIAKVDLNLHEGRVRLVVAVDFVPSELHELLGRWNASISAASYEAVWALELTRIEHATSEFLIPQVTVPRSTTTTPPANIEETLRLASAGARAVDGRVVRWAQGKKLETRTTSVSRQVVARDGRRLVTIYLNPRVDKLELNLQPLSRADAGVFIDKIAQMFGGPVAETYPNIPLDAIQRLWSAFAIDVLDPLELIRPRSAPHETERAAGASSAD